MFVNNFLAPIQVRLSPNFVNRTLGHRGRGDYILEGQGQRSRWVGEVCALLNAILVFIVFRFPVTTKYELHRTRTITQVYVHIGCGGQYIQLLCNVETQLNTRSFPRDRIQLVGLCFIIARLPHHLIFVVPQSVEYGSALDSQAGGIDKRVCGEVGNSKY